MTRIAASFAWIVFSSSIACADISLLEYDTTNPNGANGAPSPNLDAAFAQFITPLQLSRGAGVTPNQGIAFNSSNWSLANSVDLASDKYIEWGWSAATQPLDLTSLQLQYDVSGTGPNQLQIAINVNNTGFVPIFNDFDTNPGDETATIGLENFDQVDSAVFRLFGYDAGGTGGTLDIEEILPGGARGILVRGELSAVPAPNGMLLTVLGFACLGFRRRRCQIARPIGS